MSGKQIGMIEPLVALEAERPCTPIALKLRAHFGGGGSIPDAIRLVEQEELARSHRQSASRGRGTRLSPDWTPSMLEIEFALDRGMPREFVSVEAEKFRNYWIAKAGANVTKRDWTATWRNWIITTMERSSAPTNYRGQTPRTINPSGRAATGSDAILAGMGRLARRIDQRRTAEIRSGWKTSDCSNTSGELDFE
jgi:hypothetical protein